MAAKPRFKRLLLKLSGEALMGDLEFGTDPAQIERIATQVGDVRAQGVEMAVVVGAGNIYRGLRGAAEGMDRATGDYMGMLATVLNALALQDALEQAGAVTRVLSALHIREVAIHIAAMNPKHVSLEDIPEEDRERERAILEEKAKADGKPDNVIEKIVEGQLAKWASELVLLDQKHFNEERYEGKTIQDLVTEVAAKTGENVRIARFVRFEIGED